MSRVVTGMLLVVVAFLAGMFLSSNFGFSFFKPKTTERTDSVIVLEQIKKVAKLITVEGFYSETYDFNVNEDWWISAFKKNIQLQINAKVSIGYDLEDMNFQHFPDSNLLVITIPDTPRILSVDPDIVYTRKYEGVFNTFTKEELTKMNSVAKKLITKKAMENTSLMETAEEQGKEVLKLIEIIARDAGWEVKYVNPKGELIPSPTPDTTSILN